MTTLDDLRRYAVARSLFTPTTLARAIKKLGFVQADPIRAPARAQDLILRHRVKNYRAGDLERRYPKLDLEEDFFINYGYLPSAHQILMHPREPLKVWSAKTRKQAQAVLDFVREHGAVHPRKVDEHFAHGKVTNYWGGSSNASTRLLEDMHYRGLLRVVRRDNGIRVYEVHESAPDVTDAEALHERLDALIDVLVCKYAPLSASSLSALVSRLRYGVPQWGGQLKSALSRTKQRLSHASVEGLDWYWPETERVHSGWTGVGDQVRLLAPFDPIVWDRRRFELLWGWAYRFEAYTPVPKRKLGYYALPLLWRDAVIGWGNLSVKEGKLNSELGYVAGRAPKDRNFKRELEAELQRMRRFLA